MAQIVSFWVGFAQYIHMSSCVFRLLHMSQNSRFSGNFRVFSVLFGEVPVLDLLDSNKFFRHLDKFLCRVMMGA